jgi:hypothetical protein
VALQLANQVHDGGERDRVAADVDAAPHERRHVGAASRFRHEGRLADPGIAGDEHDRRGIQRRRLDGTDELGQLGLAPDHLVRPVPALHDVSVSPVDPASGTPAIATEGPTDASPRASARWRWPSRSPGCQRQI